MSTHFFPNNKTSIDSSDLYSEAIALLEKTSEELASVHKIKDFWEWREDTAGPLDSALGMVAPFVSYEKARIVTRQQLTLLPIDRLGNWAIDCLVRKLSPQCIVNAFVDEVSRNSAVYSETSPILGVQIDETTTLEKGVCIKACPSDEFDHPSFYEHFPKLHQFSGTSMLKQEYSVTPAFRLESSGGRDSGHSSPELEKRQTVRENVRLACVAASRGPVDIRSTVLVPKEFSLFVEPPASSDIEGFQTAVVRGADVERAYSSFNSFSKPDRDNLFRAIDRLGRSRLTDNPVDRSLELGIAAEILLMHGDSSGNTEITYKMGTRAGWLLGKTSDDRLRIFDEMKSLYLARSQAAHTGKFTKSVKVDLDAADRLVHMVIQRLLELGNFPDWKQLVMG